MNRFIAELQRRKVLRVASGYVVGAWVVLQVAVAVQTAMILSPSFSTIILQLLVIGFPLALVLSWFYEITPTGIRRTVDEAGEPAPFRLQTTDLILGGAVLVVLLFAAVQVTSLRTERSATDTPETRPEIPDDKSIAVLPFVDLSSEEEKDVLGDGLTEEILNVLSRVHGLRVISRTSSFAFKGKTAALPDIAQRLGVRFILEGSVRTQGDKVRITAELIDVTSDSHLWSDTFERKAEDVLATQDEIARAIALALNVELSVSSAGHGAPTKNMEAYRLYLKAREEFVALSRASALSAIDHCNQAIGLDPNFAEAKAHLAQVYASISGLDLTLGRVLWPKAEALANAALKIDPKVATAYGVLAGIVRARMDWQGSFANAHKALELEPSNTVAQQMLGYSNLFVGNFEQAISNFEEVQRNDPLFGTGSLNLLLASFANGDDASVKVHAEKLLATKGLQSIVAKAFLAKLAEEHRSYALAKSIMRSIEVPGVSGEVAETWISAIGSPGRTSYAARSLKAEADSNPAFDPVPVYFFISAYDEFFASLNRQLANKDFRFSPPNLNFIWHLVTHGKGSDPRIKKFFRDIHLVDYWKTHAWPDRCRAKGEDDFECN